MHRLRASDRSSLKRLGVAALAVAAAAAAAVPVTSRMAPSPSSGTGVPSRAATTPTSCTEGRPWNTGPGAAGCARQLLVSEIVIDDRAGAPTVLIRAQWQRARSPELMRLAGSLRPGCGDSPGNSCDRRDGVPRDPGRARLLALADPTGLAAEEPGTPDPEDHSERAEPLDLLLGGPWTQACEIDARGSSCPQLEPAQARRATQTAQRRLNYAVAAHIQRRPGWGEALLVRLTRQLE